MFNNALSKISSGINKLKEVFPFGKIQEFTRDNVKTVLEISHNTANKDSFAHETQSTIKTTSDNVVNIQTDQKPINILGDFSGGKRFKFRKHEYQLQFKDGVIINAFRNINGKLTPVKATTIRQISSLLKKSTNEINKVSYSTKRNSQNTFNTRLHGQYTYTNESKTQFTIILNKGQILQTTYKNTKNKASQDEIQLIQSSINQSTQGLSCHKSARLVKKERREARLKKENELKVTHKTVKEGIEKPNFSGSNTRNESEKFKYKQEFIDETNKQEESYAKRKIEIEELRLLRENNWKSAYKNIQKYGIKMVTNDTESLQISMKIMVELQKYIPKLSQNNGENVIQFQPAARNFENTKKLIKNIANFLTIEGNETTEGKENCNLIFNLFNKASRTLFNHHRLLEREERNTKEDKKFEGVIIDNNPDRDSAEQKFWKAYESKKRA